MIHYRAIQTDRENRQHSCVKVIFIKYINGLTTSLNISYFSCILLLSMGPWPAAKKLYFSATVPPAPVRVPSQRPLAPSITTVTSVANNKGDNEMIPGAMHRSPGICLTAEENPGKPQLEDRLMELCDQSLLQMESLTSK